MNAFISLLNEGRFPELEQLCATTLAQNKYHSQALHALGKMHALRGEHQRAIEPLNLILALPLEYNWRVLDDATSELAALWEALGRPDQAFETVRTVLRKRPGGAVLRRRLAHMLDARGQAVDAAILYSQAQLLDPNLPGDDRLASLAHQANGHMAALGEERIAKARSLECEWPWLCGSSEKPVERKEHISLLVPTRQRVDKLHNMLASIDRTVVRKDLFDVWLYVDADDTETVEFLRSSYCQSLGFRAYALFGGRLGANGAMHNELWRRSSSNAGIYTGFADDFEFCTEGWDEIMRRAFDRAPDRLCLGYIRDETAGPEQITIMGAPAEWFNANRTFLVDYFPYWFADSWIDEVAQMVQRKVQLPIRVKAQGGKGKTKNMWNLPFWSRFFLHTLPERVDIARRLRLKIYGDDPIAFLASQTLGDELEAIFGAAEGRASDESLSRLEASLTEETGAPSPLYETAEQRARDYLRDRFGVTI